MIDAAWVVRMLIPFGIASANATIISFLMIGDWVKSGTASNAGDGKDILRLNLATYRIRGMIGATLYLI